MREDSVIIFLDDDPTRAALQFQRMNKHDQERTFWVQTVKETVDMFKDYRERLDIVSLGYDLNDKKYNHPSREDSGMEVIRWLEKQYSASYSHVRFIIHSWNLSMGIKMAARLREKGYKVILVPFGS